MANDINIMVKGNREMKVASVDVEKLLEGGWERWTEPVLDLNKLTLGELKVKLEEADIPYSEKSKKDELIALLEGAE